MSNDARAIRLKSDWIAAAAIAFVTFIAFLPALGADFVRWDDNVNFLGNPNFRGLGADQLKWMWSTTLLGHYVPVSWMSLGLDYKVWGMDGRGYHLTNLLLHCSAAILLYFVALRLFRIGAPSLSTDELRIPIALAVLVFAVHPLRVESVAWVTERRDMLSLVCMLASTLLYLRWVTGQARAAYIASLLAFAVALLSKASVVTLPAVFLVLNVYPLRRLEWRGGPATRRVLRELFPFFALSLAAGVVSLFVLQKPEQLGLGHKMAVSAYSLGFYLLKTFVPTGLSPLYPMPPTIDPLASKFLLGYAIAGAAAAIAWLTRRRWPGVTAVLLCSGLIVLPLLGIVQNGPHIAADRYTYHAAAALSLIVALVLVRWPRRSIALVAVVLIPLLGALTWRQTGYWTDSNRLWARVLEVDSSSAVAHIAMADLSLAEKRNDDAMFHYERGIALAPDYAEGHNNLGVILAGRGKYPEAIEHYRRALALRDKYAEARLNLGVALAQENRLAEAIEQLSVAVSLEPNMTGAKDYLAHVQQVAARAAKVPTPESRGRVKKSTGG